jgi:3-hydroxyisobutyrate dehydrogenase-like beta-hydroxyacid dehydrogenase
MSELAERVGLKSSTLANSRQLWEHFVDELGHGNLDHSGLFRIYETNADG